MLKEFFFRPRRIDWRIIALLLVSVVSFVGGAILWLRSL